MKFMTLSRIGLLIFLWLITGSAFGVNAEKMKKAEALLRTEARDYIYKQVGRKTLHLFVFPAERKTEGLPVPAIVFFHGGAWKSGTPAKHAFECKYLAERGMTAITVQYRLTADGASTPFDSVEDARSAMRFIRRSAGEWKIDPNRIAAGGGSAGGHLAACTALLTGPDAKSDDLSISPAAAALVLFCPVIDLTRKGYRNGNTMLGARAMELSPAQHVKPGAPPTLILAGAKDGSIPLAALEQFREAMVKSGTRCKIVAYERGRHGFNGLPEYYADTICRMDEFLVSLGYLQGRQTFDEVKVRTDRIFTAASAMAAGSQPLVAGDKGDQNR